MFTLAAFFERGAKVPQLFAPGSESSMLPSLLGTNVPGNEGSREQKFQGTKDERSTYGSSWV